LDPFAVQGILARLAEPIDEIAAEVALRAPTARASDLPAGSAPAMEMFADVHAHSEVRLFAS
jgi:urease accessory protein